MFLIIGFLTAALMEYLLHRYYLHKPSHSHIVHHHKIFRKKYEDPSQKVKDIMSAPSYIFSSSLLTLITTIVWTIVSTEPAYTIYVYGLIYLIGLEYFHYLFHSPKKIWIEKTTLFQMLKEHHHLHHIHFNSNFGIGSTLFDHLLKTKFK